MSVPPRARAILLLLLYAFLAFASAPGLSSLGGAGLPEKEKKRAIRQGFPPFLIEAADAISQINPWLRAPLMKRIAPVAFHPLRIGQGWALYGDGPERVNRIEIWLDGTLRYRSGDPELDWLKVLMRDGRLRPSFDDMTTKPKAANNAGLLLLISEHGRAAGARSEIEVRCTASRFPGEAPRLRHGWRMAAPDWAPERLP